MKPKPYRPLRVSRRVPPFSSGPPRAFDRHTPGDTWLALILALSLGAGLGFWLLDALVRALETATT
jgi:hypothetical protein